MVCEGRVGVLGGTSLVGECLLEQLDVAELPLTAFTRKPEKFAGGERRWVLLPAKLDGAEQIPCWICVAPIWVVPEYFGMLEALGAKRLVALSSTSRFTKENSSDAEENLVSQRLADAEAAVQAWAESHDVAWIVLRPTLIYGRAKDKNVNEIARFIKRSGFFPLFGKAQGLRQPIHAEDVAAACKAALLTPTVANKAYNISGGETLGYRDMVARIFAALGRPVRVCSVPLPAFRCAVAALRVLPRYRKWTAAMAERMNRDLVFDHSEASRDFGFQPRAFHLSERDLG